MVASWWNANEANLFGASKHSALNVHTTRKILRINLKCLPSTTVNKHTRQRTQNYLNSARALAPSLHVIVWIGINILRWHPNWLYIYFAALCALFHFSLLCFADEKNVNEGKGVFFALRTLRNFCGIWNRIRRWWLRNKLKQIFCFTIFRRTRNEKWGAFLTQRKLRLPHILNTHYRRAQLLRRIRMNEWSIGLVNSVAYILIFNFQYFFWFPG